MLTSSGGSRLPEVPRRTTRRWATDDETLGVVDFSICPHVNGDENPGNTDAEAVAWAAGIAGPAYALDDQSAITVVDGVVEVVSEGRWTLLHD